MQSTLITLAAECGDLALAKAYLADLRDAGFRGNAWIVRQSSADAFDLNLVGGSPYGSVRGAILARGLTIGAVAGAGFAAVIFAALTVVAPSPPDLLLLLTVSIALGALIGCYVRLSTLPGDLGDHSPESRFLLRCEASHAEILKARDILRDSACPSLLMGDQSPAGSAAGPVIATMIDPVSSAAILTRE